jgi:hypothetical protein
MDFGGASIPVSKEAIHLGHLICPSRDYRKQAAERGANDLAKRANIMHARFGHCMAEVKYKLFKTFCMSAYGSNLWDLGQAETFFCTWRKIVRRLLRLPYNAHSYLLPHLVEDWSPETQLHMRFIKFIHTSSHSQNALTKTCAVIALRGSRSPVGSSVTLVADIHRIERGEWPRRLRPIQQEVPDAARTLLDFLKLRETCNDNDIDFIVNHLSTT